MTRGRAFAIVLALLGAGAGTWALYDTGKLGAASALRLGGGICTGLVLLGVLPALWPKGPGRPALEEALDSPEPVGPERPRSLKDVELAVRLACSRNGEYDVYYRLRPVLRDLAEQRLRSHRLIDLDGNVKAARGLLGDDLWDLVRSDAPAPRERSGRGVAVSRLAEWVERLEAL
jgi:hypothetical protein